MGLIRGALFTVVAIILFLSLLSMNTVWSISKSLEYDAVQTELVPATTSFILDQTDIANEIDRTFDVMQVYCVNNTKFIFVLEDFSIDLPCDSINQDFQTTINYVIADIIEENYYKEYDCNLWQCEINPPYHLVSQKAQTYWSEWFYVFLVISIILVVICFFLIENKNDYPFILGGLLIISSLIFAKIDWILSFMDNWAFIDIVAAFFSRAYNVFLITFISGVVLILVGVALKFLGLGQWLLKIFSVKKKD